MIIKNQEGLQFLSGLPDESVDLVLTDPPYITSRDSGMDKWVDHVATQDAAPACRVGTRARVDAAPQDALAPRSLTDIEIPK